MLTPFWEEPLCRVTTFVGNDDRKLPEIEAADDDLLIYFRLCKAGYAQSIREARELGTRTVIQALYYELFLNEYERAYLEINR